MGDRSKDGNKEGLGLVNFTKLVVDEVLGELEGPAVGLGAGEEDDQCEMT